MKRATVLMVAATILVSLTASKALSHCQVPCGIYDDATQLRLMAEHITTIEKAMMTIVDLSGQEKPNYNQVVRWVQNKDDHADQLSEIVTYYFMTQRIKPPQQEGGEAHAKYQAELGSLHRMLVYAMKAKQTTDLGNVAELRALLKAFEASYMP
jgi:nickel superoxide dismutase